MEARAAMAGGVRTAHGVPPSAMGSDQRSSVGHSRSGSSDRLAAVVVTVVGAAVAAPRGQRVPRSCERVLSAPELRG
eukprot:5158513-Prymnesium_polylepis.1